MLATFAEFEVERRRRAREGMAIARPDGKLKGRPPKLSARELARLLELHNTGERSISELAQLLFVSRAASYRALDRVRAREV